MNKLMELIASKLPTKGNDEKTYKKQAYIVALVLILVAVAVLCVSCPFRG